MRQRLSLPVHGLATVGLTLLLAGTAAPFQNASTPAETPGGTAQPGAEAAAPAPPVCPPAELKSVRICGVWSAPPYDEPNKPDPLRCPAPPANASGPTVELRGRIGVRVQGLKQLRDQKQCLETSTGQKRDIVLYLDRQPLPHVVAAPPSDPDTNILYFPLTRTEDARGVWTYLLGRPGLKTRNVEVSVGIDDQFAVPSQFSVALRAIPPVWFSFWVLIFAGLAIGFFLLARRSNVLRDPVSAPYGARPPYSLARVQAAWWFFLILASYLLIGMVTGDFSTSITGTTLVLLGISAGTAVGSAFIDAGKTSLTNDAQDTANATALWDELKKLDVEIQQSADAVKSGNPSEARKLASQEALRTEKLSMYRKLTHQSESFLLDILSDTGGVNFHRFQMMAWTLILGFIFVGHVYRDLAMPQFNETLLALLGVSAGTYLGLKIPESQTPSSTPQNPAAPEPEPPNPTPPAKDPQQ
jgi:hypothetical protein